MGEPWLDSLSEDWLSEPRLSSPASSQMKHRDTTQNLRSSQSRIPHLVHSMRRDSAGSSFLKPRSTRGIAKSKGIPVLSERSASSLNMPGNNSQNIEQKGQSSATVPRQASSNFSDSQQSVQHHIVTQSFKETPEWKKRIQNNENIASDGFDLFSPSKLEGMFALPEDSNTDRENSSRSTTSDKKPWASLKFSNVTAPHGGQSSSMRTSRSRAPPMACLPELNEEDDLVRDQHSMSAISSDLVRDGSMRGLVKARVSHLEDTHESLLQNNNDIGIPVNRSNDPRWRTWSGQQEIRNEVISPVTVSAKNTISSNAVKSSIDIDPDVLSKKLVDVGLHHQSRPSSSSSDHDILYRNQESHMEKILHEEMLSDLTSQSLPEDLSMGTQDFVSHGGYINPRRGAGSNETSFLKRHLSSVPESPAVIGNETNGERFRSSPPPYHKNNNNNNNTITAATTVSDDSLLDKDNNVDGSHENNLDGSVIHHEPGVQQPSSSGSPLKLFGNRDTYTNNKLLRVLSQYEQDRDDNTESVPQKNKLTEQSQQQDSILHISQFGQGELDTYNFDKEVARPLLMQSSVVNNSEKIFQSLTDLNIDGEGTIPAVGPLVEDVIGGDIEDPNIKRVPSSPAKDRTPKRRRTLLRDELNVNGVDIELKVDQVQGKSTLAGTKRKDARPGEGGEPADPKILASRAILRPRPGSRKSSFDSQQQNILDVLTPEEVVTPTQLTEALAAELASFAQGASEAHQDSRKPSLATRDYMEEANKVMEFIRARGKPMPRLSQIQEPMDSTELEADRILDLEIEEDSTVEPFSRPPSREGPVKPREDRRVAVHDPKTASHLQKYRDSDDLEMLASISAMGTLHLVDNQAATEAARVPVAADSQESSPPNMRIINETDTRARRRESGSAGTEQQNTAPSSGNTTRRTFATESSNSSGQKGAIVSGKISIPDQVGTMTFDHEKQIWVRQHLAKIRRTQSSSQQIAGDQSNEATMEDDPFEDIPDLTVDELHEAAMCVVPKVAIGASAAGIVGDAPQSGFVTDRHLPESPHSGASWPTKKVQLSSGYEDKSKEDGPASRSDISPQRSTSARSEISKHEERLHQGIPSKPPSQPGTPDLRPRVVTIAFSSPVASEIPAPLVQPPSSVSDDEDFLPPDDDSDEEIEYLRTPRPLSGGLRTTSLPQQRQGPDVSTQPRPKSVSLVQRPISRIEERDEDAEHDEGLSLVRLAGPPSTTPDHGSQVTTKKTASAYKGASILCLTPLSEFTLHQADRANHPEESFVQARVHPKALLHAHGALTLAVDTLVKAITDATPSEPFWEQLRKLDLTDSRLESVHGLRDYCSGLEMLDLSHNQVAQLDGLPSSLRHLNISHNNLNDFTSWANLRNLQYIDVSHNQIESMGAFSPLVHIRQLNCTGNHIRDIEGILDLDGLISLDLQLNRLTEVDFEGVDLPRLEKLNLRDNKLIAVRNLHCLPALRKLDLSGNSLMKLSVTEPLPHLKSLTASQNELESLDLAMMPALTELDLDNNCVTAVFGLGSALHLRRLSIRNQRNSPHIVEFVLKTPNECNEIFISSNVLPQGLVGLPRFPHYNLRSLEIAACGLKSLPTGFGDYFPNCRILNLNYNAVSELSPLLGAVKLQQLLVAGNRIKRLRRTCLTLSRIPTLEVIDLRDNPITVGFYSPAQSDGTNQAAYQLPPRSDRQDLRWLQLMDETTALRRKMAELLLAQHCPRLKESDGWSFDRASVWHQDTTWHNLTNKGVLVKMIEAPLPAKQPLTDEESALDGNPHET